MTTDVKMMTFAVPVEPDYLAFVGGIAIKHAHLDRCLRMMVKTLADVSVQEALNATEFQGSRELRERVKKLAKKTLGEGRPLVRFQDMIYRCKLATDKRNELLHSIFAKELDGELQHETSDRGWDEPPSIVWLSGLYDEIHNLVLELNTARLDGFLHEALKERS